MGGGGRLEWKGKGKGRRMLRGGMGEGTGGEKKVRIEGGSGIGSEGVKE